MLMIDPPSAAAILIPMTSASRKRAAQVDGGHLIEQFTEPTYI
jgi:hypothetical protein